MTNIPANNLERAIESLGKTAYRIADERNRFKAERDLALDALRDILPLAEAYLRKAPSDPDNAKLETARAVCKFPHLDGVSGAESRSESLADAAPQKLLRDENILPEGCYCKPGQCMAPVVMGRQMPCRDPQKAGQMNTGRREFEKWWERKNGVPSQFKQGAASKDWAWKGWKAAIRKG